MGRNRKPRPDNQRKRLKMTKASVPADTTTIRPNSPEGPGIGPGDTNQKAKVIKLVDVQESALSVVYSQLAVAIVDGEVYANSILVGRIPTREKLRQGNGRIHKVVASKKEVSIII